MTPNQLYQRTPTKTDHFIKQLKGFYYDHVPEIKGELPIDDPSKKVEVRYYKDFNFDTRRYWLLASVWFEDKPVMIIQNAGREGDDHAASFITDDAQYRAMIGHLATIQKHDDIKDRSVNPDTDIPKLTSFYGNELEGYFSPHGYE